jgi:hypothetical protein
LNSGESPAVDKQTCIQTGAGLDRYRVASSNNFYNILGVVQ